VDFDARIDPMKCNSCCARTHVFSIASSELRHTTANNFMGAGDGVKKTSRRIRVTEPRESAPDRM
jgi:hypothetical protein